jgi:RimJ/RimL family protein N-acetyltransferase
VGYLISRPFWRRGFATEAARACRDYAFMVLARDRVISLIRPENGPSQAVARRLGMTPVGETEHGGSAHLVFSVAKDGV